MTSTAKHIALILILMTFGCSVHSATERIDIHELSRFGDAYLNRNIEIIAVITESYQCRAAGNEGLVCMTVKDMQNAVTVLASPKDLTLQMLQRWSKDNVALKLSGTVKTRRAVDGKNHPVLTVRTATVLSNTEITNPLNPNWAYVPATKHVDSMRLAADSRSLFLEGKTVSLWALVNYDKPKLSLSGKPFLSEVKRYTFNCIGGDGTILATSQYEEGLGNGRKVSGSLERRDVVVAPRTIEAALFEHIIYLCEK